MIWHWQQRSNAAIFIMYRLIQFCKIHAYVFAPTEYQDTFYLHHFGYKILTLNTSSQPKVELFVNRGRTQSQIFVVKYFWPMLLSRYYTASILTIMMKTSLDNKRTFVYTRRSNHDVTTSIDMNVTEKAFIY